MIYSILKNLSQKEGFQFKEQWDNLCKGLKSGSGRVYAFQTPISLEQARQKSEKTGQTILFYEKSLRMSVLDRWQFWATRCAAASVDAYLADPRDLDQLLALGLVLVGRAKERLDKGESLEAGDCVTLELKFVRA